MISVSVKASVSGVVVVVVVDCCSTLVEALRGVAAGATSAVGVSCCDLLFFLLLFLLLSLVLLSLVLVVQLFQLDASPGGLPVGVSTIVGSFTRIGASRCC